MKRDDIVYTVTNLIGDEGHQKVLDVYNSQCPLPRGYKLQYEDPWCAATVSAVFLLNNYPDISECSCTVMVKKAKQLDLWIEDDSYVPVPGDIIMYDWQDDGFGDNQGNPDHVGIVVKVSDNKITVREGNKNKTIGNRVIDINGKYIRGYIVPLFDDDNETDQELLEDISEKNNETNNIEVTQYNSERYVIGRTYTVSVKVGLNVRKGPGMNYALVGYKNLTPDGKRHASGSALLPGTKVTCNEVSKTGSETWIRIPSGWICAVSGGKIYVV